MVGLSKITSPGRSPKRSGPCICTAGQQLTLPAKWTFYMAIIAANIEYGSNTFYSSLSTASKEKLICLSKRGVQPIFRAPPWTMISSPAVPPLQKFSWVLMRISWDSHEKMKIVNDSHENLMSFSPNLMRISRDFRFHVKIGTFSHEIF